MKGPVGVGRWVLFWSIALGGFAWDLTTKSAVFAHVGAPGSPAVPLIPRVLELNTSYNPGALWGFMRAWPYSSLVFAALSIAAAVVICYYLFVLGYAADGWMTVALALIMAGALGNCYDRLALGHVRDFVHFHVDPIGFDCAIFNFADNMLVAGAVMIMLVALRPESDKPEPPADADVGDRPAPFESVHSA